jgi:hypothetical protein
MGLGMSDQCGFMFGVFMFLIKFFYLPCEYRIFPMQCAILLKIELIACTEKSESGISKLSKVKCENFSEKWNLRLLLCVTTLCGCCYDPMWCPLLLLIMQTRKLFGTYSFALQLKLLMWPVALAGD